MAIGFPVKANYASGDILTAAQMNDLSGTLNYMDPTAKGDLFPASSGTALTRLAVGNNGETLVADSSTSTGLRYPAGTVLANPILNSAFQIWQRGTTFSTNGVYTADRWYCALGTTGTVTRQTTSDSTNLPFIQYCARVGRNSGVSTSGFQQITQSIETINSIPFAGKTITFSFYARAGANFSSASNALTLLLQSGTGTDQNVMSTWTGGVTIASPTVTLTTTWQRFTATGSVSSTANELAFQIYYQTSATAAGAADYFEVTGVQMDIGSVALPFRTYAGTIQGELAACQRYYVRFNASDAYGFTPLTGYASSTTNISCQTVAPVPMRVRPTGIDVGGAWQTVGTANLGVSSFSNTCNNGQNLRVDAAVTGATLGGFYNILANNNATSYVGWTAEL
jgi:hypothetical protein